MKTKKCPICHKSDQVIPIIYGMPGKALQKKYEKGKVKLGGCIIMEDNPQWFCKRDEKKF